MSARNHPIAPLRRTGWFVGALLLVLASALAAALIPSGPPASRLTGSAFDPSTSTVALRARAEKPMGDLARVRPRPDDDIPGLAARGADAALPFLAHLPPVALPMPVRPGARRLPVPPETRRFPSWNGARAPPVIPA